MQLKDSSNTISKRLKKINYQLLKSKDFTGWTDQQYVDLAKGVVDAIIDDAGQVVDSQMPTTMFGVNLSWSAGGAVDDEIVGVSKSTVSENVDLTADAPQDESEGGGE